MTTLLRSHRLDVAVGLDNEPPQSSPGGTYRVVEPLAMNRSPKRTPRVSRWRPGCHRPRAAPSIVL